MKTIASLAKVYKCRITLELQTMITRDRPLSASARRCHVPISVMFSPISSILLLPNHYFDIVPTDQQCPALWPAAQLSLTVCRKKYHINLENIWSQRSAACLVYFRSFMLWQSLLPCWLRHCHDRHDTVISLEHELCLDDSAGRLEFLDSCFASDLIEQKHH